MKMRTNRIKFDQKAYSLKYKKTTQFDQKLIWKIGGEIILNLHTSGKIGTFGHLQRKNKQTTLVRPKWI